MNEYWENKLKETEEITGEPVSEKLRKAIEDYSTSVESEELYCPICKQKLAVDGWFEYDEVCGEDNSPKFVCPNEECDLHKHASFWNWYGDFFSGGLPYKLARVLFPEDQYAALNSGAKEAEVSIYGKGLKRKIYLHPGLALWIMRPYIEFKYKGDKMGNVLSRKWELGFLKWDKNSKAYCTVYVSGVRMFKFVMKRFFKSYKEFYNTKSSYAVNELLENYKIEKWDKRWWSLLSTWIFNNFYTKAKQDAENLAKLWKKIEYKDVKLIANQLGLNMLPIIEFLETSSEKTIKNYKELAEKYRKEGKEDEDEEV